MEDRGAGPPAEVQDLVVGPDFAPRVELVLPVARQGRRLADPPRDVDALDERIADGWPEAPVDPRS